jgi:hypothetical protein
MPARSLVLARLTWVVLPLVFIGMLGGFHPSDRTRDVVVGAAAAVIVLLNVPAIVGLRGWRDLVGAMIRLGVAAAVLLFVAGISHERTDWDAKDAWRRCEPGARWPDEPEARCRALHMCMNEAPVDGRAFAALVAATPGCQPP